MKIVITGINGQLGSELLKMLSLNHEIKGMDLPEYDIKETISTKLINNYKPNWVIHCAAYTNVDKAEEDPIEVFKVNVIGAKNIAMACHMHNIRLCFISTDYVFDGSKNRPYKESDEPRPINIYGQSKLEAEKILPMMFNNHIIVRTQWLYNNNSNNFVNSIIKSNQKIFRIVNDQIGCPTYIPHLCQAIKYLIENDFKGIYHISNEGEASWFDLTEEIIRYANKELVIIKPISSKELNRPAIRPKYSVLSKSKLLADTKFTLPHWHIALKEFFKNDKA